MSSLSSPLYIKRFFLAALFFITYESIKYYTEPVVPKEAMPLVYMAGASVAEVVS